MCDLQLLTASQVVHADFFLRYAFAVAGTLILEKKHTADVCNGTKHCL